MAIENSATTNISLYPVTPINQALNFNRDYLLLKDHYETWSADYDSDVSGENYCGPRTISDHLLTLLADVKGENAKPLSSLRIMDACCGTGLVGKELQNRGFKVIEGCDLSPAMTDLASQTKCYSALYGGVDLTEKNNFITDDYYDVTVCCGAFIEGHLPIDAVHELIRMTAPAGILLFSTRCTFYESENFPDLLTRLTDEKKISPLQSLMSAPYLDSACSHYLAFTVAK